MPFSTREGRARHREDLGDAGRIPRRGVASEERWQLADQAHCRTTTSKHTEGYDHGRGTLRSNDPLGRAT
jgi:hypothetical protein